MMLTKLTHNKFRDTYHHIAALYPISTPSDQSKSFWLAPHVRGNTG